MKKQLPGVLIELKAGKDCSEQKLDELADVALAQINDRQYSVEMASQGVKTILKYGLAFSGKDVRVKAGTEANEE